MSERNVEVHTEEGQVGGGRRRNRGRGPEQGEVRRQDG